ncbi:hypothetical protein NP233_g12366 [Leucocoprinus birnbaumii]|uniref:Uncharacterized protein n=1 Tax=Leucocoprinus birnbaumii TaxID=56174 RepID=A0AAD5VIL7_9AGAR|nr:hypothetical protein NP233_g12366 [Leucocoprinus birnbaumii]
MVLSTLYIAGIFRFLQGSFVNGDIAPLRSMLSTTKLPTSAILANNTMIIKGWFCDLVNMWRSLIIYQRCRVPSWAVNLGPGLLYLAILVLGASSFAQDLPIVSLVLTRTSVVPVIFFVITLALNVLVTALLALRLLVYHTRIAELLGTSHGTQYISLAAIIIESALVHSSVAVLVIITASLPSTIIPGQIFLLLLSPLQGISTLLLILRVAQGKALSHNGTEGSGRLLSALRFTSGEGR